MPKICSTPIVIVKPEKCCAPLEKSQKLLLKILTCLWNQYVSNRTGSTKAFFASPTQILYDLMSSELTAIGTLLNANDAIVALNTLVPVGNAQTYVNIVSAYANANIAYLYSSTTNSFTTSTGTIGMSKPIQILNTDDCIPQAYQVCPAISLNVSTATGATSPSNSANTWVTVATVAERTGCPGVSNTGFIGLSIEVDLATFAFNSCPNLSLKCY